MKKFPLSVLLISVSPLLFAEEQTVALKVPAGLAAKACPTAVWKGASYAWKGVTDARTSREVGVQTRKGGKDPVLVSAQPALESVLNEALPPLLKACGLKLDEGTPEGELAVSIKEFYADVEKKILTGKSQTRSSLQFSVLRGGTTSKTVDVGYEIDEKKVRQKSLKQLEESLNELLARTLEQVPKADGLKDL